MLEPIRPMNPSPLLFVLLLPAGYGRLAHAEPEGAVSADTNGNQTPLFILEMEFRNVIVLFLQKPIMEAWTQTMSIPSSG
jgi:hypothetical protein